MESTSAGPITFDVIISDISSDDHINIGRDIGFVALAETIRAPTFPIQGLLYCDASRVFVPLVVSARLRTINVNFLLETGSPRTYLREETFIALGLPLHSSRATVTVHGVNIQVQKSTEQFHSVDLLGQDLLSVLGAVLEINYGTRDVLLRK